MKLIKALLFGVFMLSMNFGYEICDSTDDEFWKQPWPVQIYVWVFEHSIFPLEQLFFWPFGKIFAFYQAHFVDKNPFRSPVWTDYLWMPVLCIWCVLFWGGLSLIASRISGKILLRTFNAVWAFLAIATISLFAIDASIPFTEWTLEVEAPDHTGWAERFPNEMACRLALKRWQQNSKTLQNGERPGAPGKARCVSPSES